VATIGQMLTVINYAFTEYNFTGLANLCVAEVEKGRTTSDQQGKGRQYLDGQSLYRNNSQLLYSLREYNRVRPFRGHALLRTS